MVDSILDLEDTLNTLISDFEQENKVAVTALSLNRENQTEERVGEPIVKLHLIVPYTIER